MTRAFMAPAPVFKRAPLRHGPKGFLNAGCWRIPERYFPGRKSRKRLKVRKNAEQTKCLLALFCEYRPCYVFSRRIGGTFRMIIIQDTLVSDEIFTECFCCDLSKCKGLCCIEGDAGAPLEKEEVPLLEKYYPQYKDYMTPEACRVVEEKGFYEVFPLDRSLTTPLMDGGGQCVYLARGADGVAYCAVEMAFRAGKIPFRKPVSCHLFPIRIQHYPQYDAVNYFRWHICRDACVAGRRKGIPVFRFLKEPLVARFGEEWYKQAEAVYEGVFAPRHRPG